MPHLAFTPNLARLLTVPEGTFAGATVREVLESAFASRPEVRGYVPLPFQMVIAAPQVVYGVYAAIAVPRDRVAVVAMTTVPFAMLVHGAIEAAFPSPKRKPPGVAMYPTLRCRDDRCREVEYSGKSGSISLSLLVFGKEEESEQCYCGG